MASVSKREWEYKGQRKEAWIVRYFDLSGKQCQKTFKLKKEADAFKRQTENELSERTHVSGRDAITVKALCEAYLRGEEDRLRDGMIGRNHLHNMTACVDNQIIPHLGKRIAHEVTHTDVEDWYQWMRRDGGLQADTSRDRVKTLGRIYDYGIRRGSLRSNPTNLALKSLRGIARGTIKTFTTEQVQAILAAANDRRRGQHERAFMVARCAVHLAAFCGLRFGEIMGLTAKHIDFAGQIIEVRHSITDWDELKVPKTKSGIRDVPMPDHIAALLGNWLRDYHRPDDRGLIFRTPKGCLIDAASFHTSYWGPLLKMAGLWSDTDRFHFHALRHFAASWMIGQGLPMMDVAALLGHKRFDMTLQVYAHSIVGGSRRVQAFNSMAAKLLQPAPTSVLIEH